MIGTTVGSYRITQKVSVGGMGTVYKAQHTLIGKLAAVKVLHPELRSNREVVNRFFNEARATTQIKHPGIVEIFDFGYLPSGDGYIIMEFLEGVSLARRMRKGKMLEGKAAVLLKSVCSALAAAHAKHIVHRDLKPDNIYLCPDPEQPGGERPKLLDFGIAKLTDGGALSGSGATRTGMVMGTPTYMAPEQCSGAGAIDHRADLYALGCIFYELICGVPPFEAEGAGALLGMHLYVEPKPPSSHESSISAEAESLILSLLKKDPAERPQTAHELSHRFAVLAQSAGWMGDNAPNAVVPEADEPEEPVAEDPVAEESSAAAVSSPEPSTRTPLPGPGPNPTTLSAAASQSVLDVPRSNKGRWIGGIGVAAAAVIALAIAFTRGSPNDSGDAIRPAGAPTETSGNPSAAAPVTPDTATVSDTPSAATNAGAGSGGTTVVPATPASKTGADASANKAAASYGAQPAQPTQPTQPTGAATAGVTSGTKRVRTTAADASSATAKEPTTSTSSKATSGKATSSKATSTTSTSTKLRRQRVDGAEARPRGANKGSTSTKILIETDL